MFGGCLQHIGELQDEEPLEHEHVHPGCDDSRSKFGKWLDSDKDLVSQLQVDAEVTASGQRCAWMRMAMAQGCPLSIASKRWGTHPLVVARNEEKEKARRRAQERRAAAKLRKMQEKEAKRKAREEKQGQR